VLEISERPPALTSMRSVDSLNSADTMAMSLGNGPNQLLQEVQSLRYSLQRTENELSKNQYALSEAKALSEELRVSRSCH
jgi:uncharacterized phage infection (PIP) family protein YhgE